MKKFTDILDKNSSIEFKKSKDKTLSTDIESLDNQISKEISGKLEGEWEIVSVIDVTTNKPPDISEALIINAELGNKEIKRGDLIYITAQIKKPGQTTAYYNMQMGCFKVRVVDIYNTMSILNTLK